jgi:ABC-2 type transport system ATP-binding protein
MLELINVNKAYKGSTKKAVDNVSFTVSDGEIVGLIGPNGAGKSTIIKMIMGILNYDSGTIRLDNQDIKNNTDIKKFIGYVSDSHDVYEKLTGLEYINFICDIYGINENRKEKIDNLVKKFELEESINAQIKTYSHGMKQKIAIISALIHEPRLFILDEPLTGLDPKSSFTLKKCMREHCKKGNFVLFSSHILDVVEKLCDKVVIIDKGKLIIEDSVNNLIEKAKNEKSLEDIFLSITDKKEENNDAK